VTNLPRPGGGYQCVLSELLRASAEYKSRADDVQQMLKEWQNAANLDSSVFGNLSVSPKMASVYRKFYNQVTTDVTKHYQGLYGGAAALVLTALKYWTAEMKVIQYLREVKQDNKYLDLADSGKGP
jgi:hypothetical protein